MNTFTELATPWLNKFIKDLSTDKDSVLKAVSGFDGDKALIKYVIEQGPSELKATDTESCKEIFHFIEYYSTGSYHDIEVSCAKE